MSTTTSSGPNAYNDYTRRDANLYSVYLAKGTYTPLRFIYANAQGGGNYELKITAPDGSTIIDSSTTQKSSYLVQSSCDSSAPRFPPFGDDGPGSSPSSATTSSGSSSSPTPTSTITRTTGLQLIRQTTTVTIPASGTTPAQVVVETPLCTSGLEWVFYRLAESPNNSSHPGQIPYDTSDGKTSNPDYENMFQVITILDGQSPNVMGTTSYTGTPNSNNDNTTLLYGGQKYPHDMTGTYTFDLNNTDEVAYLWLGDSAMPSAYDNSNYALYNDAANKLYAGNPDKSYTQNFTAGSYVPIRILLANAQLGMEYDLTITDPSGNVVSSTTQEATDQQLVSGCSDSSNTAPFASY